jgi:hypothetical protein
VQGGFEYGCRVETVCSWIAWRSLGAIGRVAFTSSEWRPILHAPREDLEGLKDDPKWCRLLPQCFPDILPASQIIA